VAFMAMVWRLWRTAKVTKVGGVKDIHGDKVTKDRGA